MVATGPTKLAANVTEGHPEVVVLLGPFGEHVDHLLAPQRKLGLVCMGVPPCRASGAFGIGVLERTA